MRIVRIRRKHWILTLVLVVLGVSAWGSWLAHTGRATDYSQSSSLPFSTSTSSGVPTLPDVAQIRVDNGKAARVPMTSSRSAGDVPSASVSMTSPWPLPPPSHISLTGVTDPVVFARRVARVVLSYDADTDFRARTDRLMTVAALPPIGAPSELAADLVAFRPTTDAVGLGSVVFMPESAVPSAWAAARIERLHLPSGSFAIDVTGTQTVQPAGGGDAVPLSVTVGITGACPPTLVQCEIDRIFPHTVKQELSR